MGEVSEELIMQCYEQIHAIAPIESVTTKELNRPRVKVIFDIIYRISTATGFPSADIVIATELPKEMKQQRIDYLQKIIEVTGEKLGETIDCQAKNITAGKEVPQTLIFLIKLCEAATQGGDAPENEPQQLDEDAENPVQYPEEQQADQDVFGQQNEPEPVNNIYQAAEEEQPYPVQEASQNPPENNIYQEAQEEYQAPPHEEPQEAYQEPQQDAQEAPQFVQQSQNFALGQSNIDPPNPEQQEVNNQQKAQEVIANAFVSEKAIFNRPPPSQQRRREQKQESSAQQKTNYRVRIERDDDEAEEDQMNAAGEDTNLLAGDFGGDADLNGIFGDISAPADGEKGALMADIENVQNEFNQGIPTSQQEKRQAAQQKISNQANSKLLQAINEAVRGVIPFSKATSFLEEHLVRMRQELIQAIDDCATQNQIRQKNANIENKARSLQEARLRSVEEQIAAAKQQLCELADAVVV